MNIWFGDGMAYVIIPPPYVVHRWKYSNLKRKNGWFNDSSIMLPRFLPKRKIPVSQVHRTVIFTYSLLYCAQKYSPNCMIPVSKIEKFPASEGGTSPSPYIQVSIWLCDTPQIVKREKKFKDGSMPLVRRCQ